MPASQKRTTYNPDALEIVPASPEGIAPRTRMPAMTLRGPYRSTNGPTIRRTRSVEHRHLSRYVPTCAAERFKSDLTASGMRGEKANQDRKADQKPSHDLKGGEFREYCVFSDRIGRVVHLPFRGLIRVSVIDCHKVSRLSRWFPTKISHGEGEGSVEAALEKRDFPAWDGWLRRRT